MSSPSSSQQPQQASDQPELINIARRYGSPFPIYTKEEGKRYLNLSRRRITPPILGPYDDWEGMATLGNEIAGELCAHIQALGCQHFIRMRPISYGNLMLEFYTTLEISPIGELRYRLSGRVFLLSIKDITKAFRFKGNGRQTQPAEEYDAQTFWDHIRDETLDSKDSYNSYHIRDLSIYLAYAFLTKCVLGKTREEAKFIDAPEFYVLWCMVNRRRVEITPLVIARMREIIRTDTDVPLNLSMGTLITLLARFGGTEFYQVRRMEPTFLSLDDEEENDEEGEE